MTSPTREMKQDDQGVSRGQPCGDGTQPILPPASEPAAPRELDDLDMMEAVVALLLKGKCDGWQIAMEYTNGRFVASLWWERSQ